MNFAQFNILMVLDVVLVNYSVVVLPWNLTTVYTVATGCIFISRVKVIRGKQF